MGALSGFQVIETNLSNIHEYLDTDTLERINLSLKHANMKTYPQSKGDLYRLALIAKYGGVYMDVSYIALENFDWLLNIGKYPSQYIFNRFGKLPKVFMIWHPHYGSPF
jgi:mannosyltransferase OCH1-like enzyme